MDEIEYGVTIVEARVLEHNWAYWSGKLGTRRLLCEQGSIFYLREIKDVEYEGGGVKLHYEHRLLTQNRDWESRTIVERDRCDTESMAER